MQPNSQGSAQELNEGDRFTLTWGKEHFGPVQYQSFEVGPFDVSITIRPGETVNEARSRGRAFLARVAREEYETKLEGFLARLKDAAAKARH